VDIVQAKRASTAAAIRIRSIRSFAKNTERLSVIQYDISAIRNYTVQKRLQWCNETATRTITVGEDDGPQAARAVLFYHHLRSNRIVVRNHPQRYAPRCGAFRAPASDWIGAAVDVQSHAFMTESFEQIEKEMQR
jgi:hypothetical protein